MSVFLQFSMFPIGKGESLGKYVARSLEIIVESGLDYWAAPMSTTLEGDYDEVMDVVKKCYLKMKEDCPRVYCVIGFGDRDNREGGLYSKIKSVEEKLGIKLNTGL